MIDIKTIREDKELVAKNLEKRSLECGLKNLDKILKLDDEKKALETQINELRSKRNTGSKSKPTDKEITQMQKLRKEIGELEEKKKKTDEKLLPLLAGIPNLLHESVPKGKDEEDSILLEKIGEPKKLDFTPKAHNEIPAVVGQIDMERGSKVAGSRFYYLKGKVALMERALMNYAIDFITKKGFELTLPPILVNEQALYGTGYFPNGRNEVYAVNPGEDDLYLIGTSEQSLMAMHSDEVLDEKSLPIKYSGFSPCFRREAGSYGKDTKGILRVHQFNKVEMIILAKQEDSWKLHEDIVNLSIEFCTTLGIPFQVVQLCSGDTGVQSAKTIDFEAWFPSQNKYREIGSASNTTDYQSRRLKIRYKDGKVNKLVHALNNTVVADRTLLAILENNQTKDGNVVVPEVLQPYCGFDTI